MHGPVNPADLLTKHVDHGTQIRLLALMGVEARLGRAETAPETGVVDEHVNSVEPATEEEKEHECEFDSSDEEIFDWIHECIGGCHRPPRGGGDTQQKCMDPEETSPDEIVMPERRMHGD